MCAALATAAAAQEPIPTSLLKLVPENASRAVKMHAHIQRYCGDDGREARLPQAAAVEIIQKLLHQGLKRPELRDELYMQLVKQTRCNPLPHSRSRAWELFTLVAASMPPSKVGCDACSTAAPSAHMLCLGCEAASPHSCHCGGALSRSQDFTGLISEYVHNTVRDGPATCGTPGAGDGVVRAAAEATWAALKRSTKAGPRRTVGCGRTCAQGLSRDAWQQPSICPHPPGSGTQSTDLYPAMPRSCPRPRRLWRTCLA